MTSDPAYAAYLRSREAVLAMKQAGAAADASAYWAEELDNIDYMIEASPLIVRKLRHHAFQITNARPYDYRTKDDDRRASFEARLAALTELGGDALRVPEHPALGGFGYEIDGRLYNVDTLKFYEVLVGMERGGVLRELRSAARPLVCEIGAGWGGFAYQFKTLFPRSTYVIIDFPELFLFSATYLGAIFPDARFVFCGPDPGPSALDGWRDADFVFVPSTRADLVSALPLDLTVNMVSFQEMTEAQVRGYARMAAQAGCPLLYSLNRERSPYNTELTSVSHALADAYELSEIEVLGSDYTRAFKGMKAVKAGARETLGYRHLVGRRRSALPRVALGMTLYNNARHLPEALDSILAQTHAEFTLVLLDDASSDGTEAIAREYERRDPRVRYFRHESRQAMIATWREVVDIAARECPGAEYFAWVSDHDRWHERWLETLMRLLDDDRGVVLAYPVTERIDDEGRALEKAPRRFDTDAEADRLARWSRFCHRSVGAGDMVYGLMRIEALRACGIFRAVLRPDKLLIAELTLRGRIRQSPETLWFRRQSGRSSVARQQHTLVLPGQEPRGFRWAPSLQHIGVLYREYAAQESTRFGIARGRWIRMLVLYQLTYGWRHVRKSETFHALNRALDRLVWGRKIALHHIRRAIFVTLVGWKAVRSRMRRRLRAWSVTARVTASKTAERMAWVARASGRRVRSRTRRAVYHLLVLSHRAGLRGGNGETRSS